MIIKVIILPNTAIGVWIVEICKLRTGADGPWDLDDRKFQLSRDGEMGCCIRTTHTCLTPILCEFAGV
jgi:hypothetical protein